MHRHAMLFTLMYTSLTDSYRCASHTWTAIMSYAHCTLVAKIRNVARFGIPVVVKIDNETTSEAVTGHRCHAYRVDVASPHAVAQQRHDVVGQKSCKRHVADWNQAIVESRQNDNKLYAQMFS